MSRFLAGIGVIACIACAAAAGEAGTSDWPRWRGPLGTGESPASPPLIESLPEEGLQPAWVSVPIKGAREGGWASPAVADGNVYLFSHEREQLRELGPVKYPYLDESKRAGMSDAEWKAHEENRRQEGIERARAYAFREHVYAFDAATGEIVWHNRSESVYSRWPQSGSPTIVDGRLYVLGGGLNLRCLDAKTGADLWTRKLPGEFVDEYYQSSVLVVDGIAVVMAGHLFGVDAATGDVRWEGDARKSAGTHSSPAAWMSPAGARVVINLGGGWTACFDARDGRELWRVKTEGALSTPVVVGDRMITYGNSRQKGLRCFRMAETGAEQLWKFHGTQDKGSSPAVVGGHVYVQGEKRIACVNLETGVAEWTGELDLASPQFTSLIAADGKVFYAYDGLTGVHATPEGFEPFLQARFNSQHLMASDATLRKLLGLDEIEQKPNGLEQSMRILEREVNRSGPLKCSTPAIADGRLYVRTNTALVCYDLRRAVQQPE